MTGSTEAHVGSSAGEGKPKTRGRRCEAFFSENSYGFRPKRSAHDAVLAAQELVKQGKKYVVDIDLKSFFDEVNHDKLMHLLDNHVEDKSLRKLIGAILRAPVQRPDGSRYKRGKGSQHGFILPWLFAEAAAEKGGPLPGSTAGCGKPRLRWCGRAAGGQSP